MHQRTKGIYRKVVNGTVLLEGTGKDVAKRVANPVLLRKRPFGVDALAKRSKDIVPAEVVGCVGILLLVVVTTCRTKKHLHPEAHHKIDAVGNKRLPEVVSVVHALVLQTLHGSIEEGNACTANLCADGNSLHEVLLSVGEFGAVSMPHAVKLRAGQGTSASLAGEVGGNFLCIGNALMQGASGLA